MKRFVRRPGVQRAIARLAALYLWLAHRTTRWRIVGDEHPARRAGRNFVGAFWHGRMLMMPMYWNRRAPMHMLISEHPDGRLISQIIGHFGILTIAGSTSTGGAQALRQMIRAIKAGEYVAMTPDGPRGPRMRAATGVVSAARLAGAPIFPIAFSTTRGRVLHSWDRMLVPYPFGRGVFIIGEPIEVPPAIDDEALEAARATLETRLNAITAEADRMCGRRPVEPMATSAAPRAADLLGQA